MGGRPRKNVDPRYKYVYRPRGKGTKRPEVAVAAERGGRIAAAVIPSSDGRQLGRFMERFISPDARIMSDDDKAIGKAARVFGKHDTVVHGRKEFARGDVHANTVESISSLLKRAQLGVYHRLSPRHLQRYVDEIVFRKNQRRRTEVINPKDGVTQVRFNHRPFIDQLSDLLERAVGRQVRRAENGGLSWPEPIGPGYVEAPSICAA